MVVSQTSYNKENKLQVSNLAVIRSDLPIFEPISFELKSGQSIQVRGANGAGKTTLLRAVCGLNNSYEGEVLWNTSSVSDSAHEFYNELLYLGHALGLKPKLTAEQNLNFYRELRFSPDPQLILKALNMLGIGAYHDEFVAHMSAGQKRRVALSRIISEPVALWILDEPMVALDIDGQKWLEGVCNQHLERGGMLLITSHQPVSGINGLRELTLQ